MLSTQLLTRTRELYRERRKTQSAQDIAKDTGLNLSWLEDLSWLRSKSPDVNKVETLYVYLAGKPLDLGA